MRAGAHSCAGGGASSACTPSAAAARCLSTARSKQPHTGASPSLPPWTWLPQVMLPQIQRALGEARQALEAAEREHRHMHAAIVQKEKQKKMLKF